MKGPVILQLFPQHFHVHDMSPSGADVRCEWRTTQERLSKVRVEVQDFRLALLLIDWGTANLGLKHVEFSDNIARMDVL